MPCSGLGLFPAGTGELWKGVNGKETGGKIHLARGCLGPRWAAEKPNAEVTQAKRLESRGSRMGSSGLDGCVSCGRPSQALGATEAQMAPPPATGAVGRRGPSLTPQGAPGGSPCRHGAEHAQFCLCPPRTSLFKNQLTF